MSRVLSNFTVSTDGAAIVLATCASSCPCCARILISKAELSPLGTDRKLLKSLVQGDSNHSDTS
jgi:hypothetical protein